MRNWEEAKYILACSRNLVLSGTHHYDIHCIALSSHSFAFASASIPFHQFVFVCKMVRFIDLIFLASLLAFSSASPETAGKKVLGLTRVSTNTGLNSRSLNSRSLLQKRCQGTCSECFGAGYISCPGSEYLCYLPGDSNYGIDSCSGSGSGTGSAPSPTTTGSAGNSDYCSGQYATCISCFGPGYLSCPDGKTCCELRKHVRTGR